MSTQHGPPAGRGEGREPGKVAEPAERDVAHLALLSAHDEAPGRLAELLEHHPDPLVAARTSGLDLDLATARAVLRARGTRVLVGSDPGFPIEAGLPDRPAILLVEGDRPEALEAPRVAIVGTRAATPNGLDDARAVAGVLADTGVTIVSGLAIGIDAAAHEGALDATGLTVGVVATGLDVVYPRRHRTLYERVRRSGVLVSEHRYGAEPIPRRFPVRNRIIAGLCQAVVVVEATLRGGARITAELAMAYGIDVLAMPGSRRNAAAAGCNALIADGAHPLLDPSDVLVALGMPGGSKRVWHEPDPRPPPAGHAAQLMTALAGEPATPDQLISRTGLTAAEAAVALAGLERERWVTRSRGMVWPS